MKDLKVFKLESQGNDLGIS